MSTRHGDDELTEFDVGLRGACGLLALLQFLHLAPVAQSILCLLPEVVVLNQLALKPKTHKLTSLSLLLR